MQQLLLARILFVLVLTSYSAVHACMNAVEVSRNQAIRLISQAEAALAAGDTQQVLRLLGRQFTLGCDDSFRDEKQGHRMRQLWAVARLRGGGTGDIADAIAILRRGLASAGKDPWLQVRLAEALSRTEQGATEARGLLEELAKRDLIVDAEGFATLARLRKQASDQAGAAQALARCQAMAKQKSICTDAPLGPPRTTPRLRRLPCKSSAGLQLIDPDITSIE